MTFRQLLWWVTLSVCVVAAPLEARNLFVMPSGGVSTTNVYSADSFLSGGSFAYSPASFLSLSMPTGTKYYIVARATADTIIVANSGFTPMLRIPLAQVAEAAAALAVEGAIPLPKNAYKIQVARALVRRAILAAA